MVNTANTQKKTKHAARPDFIAWNVTRKNETSYWNKIGAAWRHVDREGYTIQLDVVPINGRIVLRQPLEDYDRNESA